MTDIKYDNTTLESIIERDKNCEIVLPHFQRKYVWKKEAQEHLLLSVLAGVPIGSFLLLKGNYQEYASKPLCFNSYNELEGEKECKYLLDGQQRLSTIRSMFSDLFSDEEVNEFKKDEVEDWKDLLDKLPTGLRKRWFLRIDGEDDAQDIFGYKTLEFKQGLHEPSDYEKYIECHPLSKRPKKTNEFYVPTSETRNLISESSNKKLVPLWLFGNPKNEKIVRRILESIAISIVGNLDKSDKKQQQDNRVNDWVANIIDFIKGLLKTKIAIVVLPEDKVAVGISVFEQVNRGGTPLDIYDLLVARMARHEDKRENLTKNIQKVIDKKLSVHDHLQNSNIQISEWNPKDMDIWDDKDGILSTQFRKFFKNCLPISRLYAEGNLKEFSSKDVKEKAVLDLSAKEIYDNWKITVEKLLTVMQFLQFRCGVEKIKDLPYTLLVVPLFICCLKDEKPDFNKMEYWYWASIFSGYYREKQSDRIVGDSIKFLEGNNFEDREEKIFSDQGYSDEKSLLRKGDSKDTFPPLDKTISQYVVSKFPYDLVGRKNEELIKIAAYKIVNGDIKKNEHHIIPINEVGKDKGDDKKDPINSPLNKVIISKEANLEIVRVTDYEKIEESACKTNLIPMPMGKEYTKDPNLYNLDAFLSARFKMIEKDVAARLQSLRVK